MNQSELDIAAPSHPDDEIDPVSGLPWRRLLIPKKYVLAFKRIFGEGVEVHAVLGRRVLVSDIKPEDDRDAANKRLKEEGKETMIHSPDGYWQGDHHIKLQDPPACTGFVISIGDKVDSPYIREGGCVAFGKHAGTGFLVSKERFHILDQDEILFVIRSIEGQTMTSVHVPVREDAPDEQRQTHD